MLVLLEIAEVATVEAMIVSVPESVGLLAFGIGLVILAVLIRSFLGRGTDDKKNDESTKKA